MKLNTTIARRRAAALVLLALAAACGEAKKAPPAEKAPVAPPPAAPAIVDPAAPETYRVAFETSKGSFTVEVTRSLSPRGADRLYHLVQENYFNDVRFFRVLPGFVVQFGMSGDAATNKKWSDATILDDPVKESNKRGTLTFATSGPNTRGNQFFVNLADNASLDAQGFSPFGRVVDGMKVVDSFNAEYGSAPSDNQPLIAQRGNAYLTQAFPKLDYIKSAKIVK